MNWDMRFCDLIGEELISVTNSFAANGCVQIKTNKGDYVIRHVQDGKEYTNLVVRYGPSGAVKSAELIISVTEWVRTIDAGGDHLDKYTLGYTSATETVHSIIATNSTVELVWRVYSNGKNSERIDIYETGELK